MLKSREDLNINPSIQNKNQVHGPKTQINEECECTGRQQHQCQPYQHTENTGNNGDTGNNGNRTNKRDAQQR